MNRREVLSGAALGLAPVAASAVEPVAEPDASSLAAIRARIRAACDAHAVERCAVPAMSAAEREAALALTDAEIEALEPVAAFA
jgi:hypothetical protein